MRSLFLTIAGLILTLEFASAELRWDFETGTENWTASNMTGLTASGGILSATSTGNDPYFLSENALGESLTGISQVRLRLKNPSNVDLAAIYFTTLEDNSFVGNFVTFPISTNDTEFQEYTVTMSGHPDWGGTLNRLRLDIPHNGNSNGSLIELDWCSVSNTPPPGAPNIIMILADDLGWNDTSVNGSTYYPTPNLQRLADAGMNFTNAYSANPLCSPTRASILSGQYPARLRFTTPNGHIAAELLNPIVPATAGANSKLREPQSLNRFPDEVITYAETMRPNGYATAFMGKWHLGYDPYIPDNQGFETVIGGRQHPGPPGGYFAPFSGDSNLPTATTGTHVNDLLVDEALSFISAKASQPFLLNLWFYDVHGPFESKAALKANYTGTTSVDGRQRCPTMGGMIEAMDDGVGRVLDHLDTLGLTNDTIIIFYSDNGGNMYNWVDDALPTHNWPLRQGKASIHEGGHKVPCIISWPGTVAAGSTSDEFVSSVDLYPTILEMAGLSPDPTAIVDGVSIIPALEQTGSPRSEIYCHFPHSVVATGNRAACSVRQGDWKLIRFFHDNPDTSHRYELYNLATDSAEQNNVASSNPSIVTSLDALISTHLTDTNTLVPLPNPNYNPDDTGWEPNEDCRLRLIGDILEVTSSGFTPTIQSTQDLTIYGTPASLELRMTSRSFGNGLVSWRTPGQSGFPQSTPFAVTHNDTEQTYQISLPATGPIEALAIQVSSDASQSDISEIILKDSSNAALFSWPRADTDGDGKFDDEEETLNRNPNDEGDLGFEFETDGDFEEWSIGNNITGGQISNSTFNGTASTGDPQFQHLSFDYPVASIPKIAVRVKAGANAVVQLFFATDTNPSFVGQFLSENYTNSGEWQTLVFDLASDPDYTGTVKNLRLDPIGTPTTFEIDWIRASDGDADDDGVPDGDELAGDADGDGFQNYQDSDSDNDGQSDLYEWLSGSDLLDPNNKFYTTTSTSAEINLFHLHADVIPNRIYALERLNPDTMIWTTVDSAGPFTSPENHQFSAPITTPKALFRLRITQN